MTHLRYGPRFRHTGIARADADADTLALGKRLALDGSRHRDRRERNSERGEDWRNELEDHKRQADREYPDHSNENDELAAAEQRMVDRLVKAIEMISFGIAELSELYSRRTIQRRESANNPLGCSLSSLADLTRTMARFARQPVPEFATFRQPGSSQPLGRHRCARCSELFEPGPGEIYCEVCTFRVENIRQASEQRRTRERFAAEQDLFTKELSKAIGKLEKRLRGDDDA